MNRSGYLVFGVALLVGCSSPSPPARPVVEEIALRLSQRGEDAYRRGNLREALAAYEEARRHYASIDDAKGLATQLLNLGTVHYAMGERDTARRLFEQVLLLGTQVSAAMRADAAYRVALIDFDGGNFSSTGEWLERSLTLCPDAAVRGAGSRAQPAGAPGAGTRRGGFRRSGGKTRP